MTPERRAEREREHTWATGIAFLIFIVLYLVASLPPGNR